MAVREDIVASAAQFLQDPSVSTSSMDDKVSFLRSKNLSPEEIDAALSRAGGGPVPLSSPGNSQQPFRPYAQYSWQPPPLPQRDWRDWFIMATVVSGLGYGLYSLGKRYIYPLVAPPTPDRLERDKKSIEDQFDGAFALVEQLSKDTEELKAAEQQRTKRLDKTLTDLESTMAELKRANGRREDDAQRIRDDVQALKDLIPKAMNSQKDLTDSRLSEVNNELASLKTLISQRINSNAAPPTTGGFLRAASGGTIKAANSAGSESGKPDSGGELTAAETPQVPGLSNGKSRQKASIPAWQMAAAGQSESPLSTTSSPPTAATGAKIDNGLQRRGSDKGS